MGDANAVLRYLADLNGTKPAKLPSRAVRGSRKKAEQVLHAALSLNEAALDAAINDAALDASTVAFLVHLATAHGASQHQRKAATAKNAKAREFVRIAWVERPDLNEGKAAFARRWAPIVLKKFRLKITPDTIARDWIPMLTDGPQEWPVPSDVIAWTGRNFAPRKQ